MLNFFPSIASLLLLYITQTVAFTPFGVTPKILRSQTVTWMSSSDVVSAPSVTGEELEIMLTEFEQPLVVDAYATWCGPCEMMAPEFEAAAKEMEGKVRFVKLDTDNEVEMAGRLNIMGLPTLLFLDKLPADKDTGAAKAVLKDRIEGALRKESILEICEYLFFDGPKPGQIGGAPN